jgi:hypothetical protein
MNRGHMELWELMLAALLVIGLAAGVYMIMAGSRGPQAAANLSSQQAPALAENTTKDEPAPIQPAALTVEPALPLKKSSESLAAMLEDSMARADSWFYKDAISGELRTNTFRWYLGNLSSPPDSVPLKENDIRAADVRFNDRYEDGLRGFIFRTYELKDQAVPTKIFATAIFLSNETPLDPLAENKSAFKVYYGTHPMGAQIIEGCTVLSKDQAIVNQSVISVYDMSCKVMYGAN